MTEFIGIRPILFLTLFAILAGTGLGAQPASERGTITVTGQGRVRAEPDIATVQIGVETFSPDVSTATTENRTRMQSVFQTLLSLGIEERDLQTTNYNVFFERRYPEPPQPLDTTESGSTGVEGTYHVVNTLTVTVRDLQSLGSFIDRAIDAGANQLFGVQFGVDDPEVHRKTARTQAVEDARQRAVQIASAAQVELGELLSVTEVPQFVQGGPQPMFREMADATPVASGELEFTVNLEAAWSVR